MALLVQRNITLLSGEICIGGMRVIVAPVSRACPKTWNAPRQLRAAVQKSAEVIVRTPLGAGKGRAMSHKEELRTNLVRGYDSNRSRPNRRVSKPALSMSSQENLEPFFFPFLALDD